MLSAKRAPLYVSLILIMAMMVLALLTILLQSRQQTGTLWAGRAADLYAQSLDISKGRDAQIEMLTQSRTAMMGALQSDPYNAAHWLRLGLISHSQQNLEGGSGDNGSGYNSHLDIIKRLNYSGASYSNDNVLPSNPSKPSTKPD